MKIAEKMLREEYIYADEKVEDAFLWNMLKYGSFELLV